MKKLRSHRLLSLIASVGFMASFAAAPVSAQVNQPVIDFGPTEKLTFVSETGRHTFDVEVADTLEKQARGYMFRDEVGPQEGMIFEFAEPKIATIWMKNTGIFLDIIFVRENGKVLKIEHYAKPYSSRRSSSEAPVAAVVELAGGRARQLGIKPGDIVEHEFFSGKLP